MSFKHIVPECLPNRELIAFREKWGELLPYIDFLIHQEKCKQEILLRNFVCFTFTEIEHISGEHEVLMKRQSTLQLLPYHGVVYYFCEAR